MLICSKFKMYSKIVILFFCVTLYFLQCQGVRLTKQRQRTIKNIVNSYAKPEGIVVEANREPTINLNGVKDVIEQVAQRLSIQIEPPRIEELETIGSSYRYTSWEVDRHVCKYLGYDGVVPSHMRMTVSFLYGSFDRPDGICFHQLEDILRRLREGYDNTIAEYVFGDEPKTAIPYKTARAEYKFTKKEVIFMVVNFFFPGVY
ncbi:uncharacterized protein LOC126839875 [Adelges cooleyi]|uniref:uncharacterized protein LOC126839875 n=1 Tax=Adelges cooleyi TaxID=133065 RepID=UPI00218082EB|nr:uncharacterized protein LOC126839875 [Adelges cooleyi]